ncbi:DUF6397 family protein [Streptomyces sp. NPDC017556]|uniref:DUF6397 family protein n=1 Tax=Streptomyces sp. NPDC017556 TaxID=3365002 RepID=UPI003794308A
MTVKEVFRAHSGIRGTGTRAQAARAGARGARAIGTTARGAAHAEDTGPQVEGEGGRTASAAPAATVAAGRAAQELGIRRAEFELAVHLGLIAVVGAPGGGRPRVREEEIARLREQPGFPDGLAERVRTVGTAEGAALLGIAPARFTRLARAGCVSPVTFYLNRYRAVVWLYLADELAAFAAREPDLLAGRTPLGMRSMLESGADWRSRNWRSQRVDRLLNRTRDPWARTAVQASALDPVQLAEVVDDPYERAYLVRVRPEPVFGRPGSMTAREAMGELMLADHPDEILWRRVNLTLELDGAREDRPAPRPGDDGAPRAVPAVRTGAVARNVPALAATAADPAPPSAGAGASGFAAAGVPTGKGLLARLGWRGRGAG